jgi:hypothetical protein
MKTLSNLSLNNKFDEIVIGQVTICAPSADVYKLTLPIDTGTTGQVLTTDGNGVTSWTEPTVGTVTSIDIITPTFLDSTGGPITDSGSITLAYNGTALPVTSGGTGVTTSTGTGSVVLSNQPTLAGSVSGTPPLQVNNTANFVGDNEILRLEAPNMPNDSYLKSRMGKNLGNSNNYGAHTFYHDTDGNTNNSFTMSAGSSSFSLKAGGGAAVLSTPLITNNNGKEFIYDEGTWTPDYKLISGGVVTTPDASITTNFAEGSWIRLGKKITVFFDMGFDIDDEGDRFVLGAKFVCLSGLPFKCDAMAGGSNFGNRNQNVESAYPNGIAGVVPAPSASTYSGPFDSVVHAENESVRLAINGGVVDNVATPWTSDGLHILLFATNNFIVPLAGTAVANNCVSNFNLLALQSYSDNRFKGSVDYFIA